MSSPKDWSELLLNSIIMEPQPELSSVISLRLSIILVLAFFKLQSLVNKMVKKTENSEPQPFIVFSIMQFVTIKEKKNQLEKVLNA